MNAAARRRHGMELDDAHRLEQLLETSACAAISTGCCFVCKAVDSEGYAREAQRHVLTMINLGQRTFPKWLIHE
jgi:hypothetical protein